MKHRVLASVVLAIIILVSVGAYLYQQSQTKDTRNLPPPPPPEVRAAMRAEIERRLKDGTLKQPDPAAPRPTTTQIKIGQPVQQ